MKKMRNAPNEWTFNGLFKHINEGTLAECNGKWVPARPMGYFSFRSRLRIAWRVFKGECDALKWPGGQ